MDTAFYNRTGFSSGWSFGEVNFYPRESSNFWLRRVHPYYWLKRGYDQVQNGNEDFLKTGIQSISRAKATGYLSPAGTRAVARTALQHRGGINLFGTVQIFRWLNINGNFGNERAIYYDPVNPFLGKARTAGVE